MFKYIRTVGAHTAAPEISTHYVDVQASISAGSVMFRNDYGLTTYSLNEDHSDAKYLVLENYDHEKSAGAVKTMLILPGMIFEVGYTGTPDVGDSVLLGLSDDGNYYDHIVEAKGKGARIINKDVGPNKCWVQLAW